MKKTILTLITILLCSIGTIAQDACFLIGTDGKREANHASATLEKTAEGVFNGEVTFSEEGREFVITTQLGSSDDLMEIIRFCYGPKEQELIMPGEPLNIGKWEEVGPMRFFRAERMDMTGGGSEGIEYGKTYTVTVNFKENTILVAEESTPEPEPDPKDDGTTPTADIDLTSGKHITVNVNEVGTLQQMVTNAINQTNYDMVDFLTIKGKMGGKDLKYLKDQEGLVSQLQYLDISEIELVYDDEVYSTTSVADNHNTIGGIVDVYTTYYTLSAENKDEAGNGSFDGTTNYYVTYCRRNNLAAAFSGLKHLKQIKLPNALPGLGEDILNGCSVLEKVTFPEAATYIGDRALVNETEGYFPTLLKTLKGVDLPESIDSLGVDAMRGIGIRTIDISRISRLGEGCLRETNISSLQLHSSLQQIPAKAFSGCERLKTVTIPSTVTSIGDNAFDNCNLLAAVNLPNSIKAIGKEAFSHCKKLTAITIPGSAETIGDGAFSYCDLRTVVMEEGVRAIGAECFRGNEKLSDVTVPNSLEEVGEYAFYGWLNFGVGEYQVPWINSLPLEDGVKYVGKVAYLHMGGGSDINIKEGTVGIADRFVKNSSWFSVYGAPALRLEAPRRTDATATLTLPATLRVVGKHSFKEKTFSTVTSLNPTPPAIDPSSFSDFSATLIVPAGSRAAYTAASRWNSFSNIKELDGAVIIGDANGDGTVDVADVVAIVNYILNKPGENFNEQAADVNGDGVIDVADVVGVVNIILRGDNQNT